MKWTPLSSTNLEAFDYDAVYRVLHVRFRGGRIYSFAGVPAIVAQELAKAQSPGKFFRANVKGQYKAIA